MHFSDSPLPVQVRTHLANPPRGYVLYGWSTALTLSTWLTLIAIFQTMIGLTGVNVKSVDYEEIQLTVHTDMAVVARAMAWSDSGLEIRDRQWLKITIPHAFIGWWCHRRSCCLCSLWNVFRFHRSESLGWLLANSIYVAPHSTPLMTWKAASDIFPIAVLA